ncbi:probable ATP-dependent DNA helicase HFM1, partial [Diaphorina citri]|uniref:Probable ATP-dependent DNA helicase HFM1 n=1 Tax=Diaphorina citri TaxID=121845 RepID=A0A3Q0JE21_DIACI
MSIQTSPEVREIVDKCMSNIMDNKLKDMLRSSIGYHHAGMSPEDRTIIEQLFRSGYLMILVSTSSLGKIIIFIVHLLGEESRGPVLEAVVCRMRTVQKSQRASQPIRFVAVSATIPNIYDIALWLGFGKPTVYAQIDDSFRPVKLTKIVRGFPTKPSQSTFQFEMMLSYKLKSIIMQYSDNKPTLIFCATRKGVEHTCTILRQEMSIQTSPEVREIVDKCMSNMMDNKLK